MKPLFDRQGRTVAWLDGEDIYNLNGSHAGHVDEDGIYLRTGARRGSFSDGFFRDARGHAVAFVEGASNGPLTPITQIPPIAPIPAMPPIPPIPPISPIPPIPSLSWSSLDWPAFLRGI